VKSGNDVMMGPEVIILTQNHKFDRLDIPMWKQGYYPPRPGLSAATPKSLSS
jgi:maltose O-acetyltransferase